VRCGRGAALPPGLWWALAVAAAPLLLALLAERALTEAEGARERANAGALAGAGGAAAAHSAFAFSHFPSSFPSGPAPPPPPPPQLLLAAPLAASVARPLARFSQALLLLLWPAALAALAQLRAVGAVLDAGAQSGGGAADARPFPRDAAALRAMAALSVLLQVRRPASGLRGAARIARRASPARLAAALSLHPPPLPSSSPRVPPSPRPTDPQALFSLLRPRAVAVLARGVAGLDEAAGGDDGGLGAALAARAAAAARGAAALGALAYARGAALAAACAAAAPPRAAEALAQFLRAQLGPRPLERLAARALALLPPLLRAGAASARLRALALARALAAAAPALWARAGGPLAALLLCLGLHWAASGAAAALARGAASASVWAASARAAVAARAAAARATRAAERMRAARVSAPPRQALRVPRSHRQLMPRP
jgi:hypothetical protein